MQKELGTVLCSLRWRLTTDAVDLHICLNIQKRIFLNYGERDIEWNTFFFHLENIVEFLVFFTALIITNSVEQCRIYEGGGANPVMGALLAVTLYVVTFLFLVFNPVVEAPFV